MLLHAAMFILLSKSASNIEWNQLAKNLLEKFVTEAKRIYGAEFLVYNVHGLLHLADDALRFGCLDNVSTFAFENFMQRIKRMLHAKNYQLEQVAKRISETTALHSDKPQFIFKFMSIDSCLNVSLKRIQKGNACFHLFNNDVIIIESLLSSSCSGYEVKIRRFDSKSSFTSYPFDSSKVGILNVSNLSEPFVRVIKASDVQHKCVILPNENEFVVLPLLHSISE
jgi:hypothetical protein